MEATESVLRSGYRLDRYELLRPIATGGMATVWLAKLKGKRGFEKLFAIKTIRTELAVDMQFEEMFLDEARIASGIQHPNVAQILDLGEQEGVLFIVMEWVDGDSLAKIRKLLAREHKKLPVGIILRVLSDASAGLHAAHELRDEAGEPLGIVHRDVSPQNILVSSSGVAKVIDFGIAKARKRQQGETRTGIVKGKVQYMAPEQVKKGGKVDRRTDLWALGMCLHELLTGELPHGGEDDVGVVRRLMSDEPPTLAPDLPPPISRLLERSIALDPDGRFPTAAGMQRAIEGAMKEVGEAVSSEDVAAFLRAELPELAQKRREAVGRAIEEARGRTMRETESRDEVAFAPTVVGDRDGRAGGSDEARAIALIQRKAGQRAGSSKGDEAARSEDSRVTPTAALEQEPITIPKRGLGWVWALALLVGGAIGTAAVWPSATQRVLETLGLGRDAPGSGLQPPPSVEPPAYPSLAETRTASSVSLPAVSPSEVRSAAPAWASPHAPFEGPTHPVSPTPTAPPSAHWTLEPDAKAALPGITAPPLPPPPDNEEDPNNPYNAPN